MSAADYLNRRQPVRQRKSPIFVFTGIGVGLVALLIATCSMVQTVPTGSEAVGTRFGKVTGEVLTEGFHLVNPLNSWDQFSTLQQSTYLDDIWVPAADQQSALFDLSIQWRIKPGAARSLRSSTGNEVAVTELQFLPNARSAIRDAGRRVERVEDFYSEESLQAYRDEALEILHARLDGVGLEVQDILVREVKLPQIIADAITAKKQREQQVEQERAELERVRLQMQQQVAKSEADFAAAKLDADAKKIRAEAEAFAIREVREQVSPTYVEYMNAMKWDGAYPQVMTGDAVPFLQLNVPQRGK